ncbi:hypothetical protein CRG98_022829 [Punica granatum]|uniref:Uncharacterized protein n=1 Tax=Punica granatum TaxID=22663 RepID=A0A2I0JKI1_PUNGR|nr:hypothetical protein CRG98_022829 [Punica granatum]
MGLKHKQEAEADEGSLPGLAGRQGNAWRQEGKGGTTGNHRNGRPWEDIHSTNPKYKRIDIQLSASWFEGYTPKSPIPTTPSSS